MLAQARQRAGPAARRALVDLDHLVDQTIAQEEFAEALTTRERHRRAGIEDAQTFDQGDGEKKVSGEGGLEDEVSQMSPRASALATSE